MVVGLEMMDMQKDSVPDRGATVLVTLARLGQLGRVG